MLVQVSRLTINDQVADDVSFLLIDDNRKCWKCNKSTTTAV